MSSISQKLASGSALRVANVGATTLISLLILPFVIRVLGDRMYGVWTLVATFIGYYGILELGTNDRCDALSVPITGHGRSRRI